MKFILLTNVKMQTIVGILTFIRSISCRFLMGASRHATHLCFSRKSAAITYSTLLGKQLDISQKQGQEVIQCFSCSTQLSMNLILLMLLFLIFISRIKTTSDVLSRKKLLFVNLTEHEICPANNCWHF